MAARHERSRTNQRQSSKKRIAVIRIISSSLQTSKTVVFRQSLNILRADVSTVLTDNHTRTGQKEKDRRFHLSNQQVMFGPILKEDEDGKGFNTNDTWKAFWIELVKVTNRCRMHVFQRE